MTLHEATAYKTHHALIYWNGVPWHIFHIFLKDGEHYAWLRRYLRAAIATVKLSDIPNQSEPKTSESI